QKQNNSYGCKVAKFVGTFFYSGFREIPEGVFWHYPIYVKSDKGPIWLDDCDCGKRYLKVPLKSRRNAPPELSSLTDTDQQQRADEYWLNNPCRLLLLLDS
ncbi:MAG: hypothetical protein ACWGOX_10350, partial [Desulforhopalus sp.]